MAARDVFTHYPRSHQHREFQMVTHVKWDLSVRAVSTGCTFCLQVVLTQESGVRLVMNNLSRVISGIAG